ncbi:WhiB family transcriptional regulator [Microbacterium sp. 13-71-7]|uniref:WhiB family transcriptional regulator n=1 Tax=Microbacterium sp. 13-71-7 TaxID=1970399 RepID=UPI0025D2B95D|nr:WhiB family transcriptional regulator [Microbacterium sp. 13-71-7]
MVTAALSAQVSHDRDEGWRASAHCSTAIPEIFFPEARERADHAKEICGGCPVREDCLRYAIVNDERDGIWGAATPRERRSLVKRLSAGEPVSEVASSASISIEGARRIALGVMRR